MKPTVKITIEGPQGSGKSIMTMALIAGILSKHPPCQIEYTNADSGLVNIIETSHNIVRIFEKQTP